jgi:Lon protease-like protein
VDGEASVGRRRVGDVNATSGRLPLFPLNVVLFPGGVLPLRVFEARYMDMVRRAMRDGSTFGVVLIRQGSEVGDVDVATEEVGCRARIDRWDMEQLGVLQIATTGTERFTIVSRNVEPDGLIVADVVPLEEEAPATPAADARPCIALLEQVTQRIDEVTDAAMGPPIAKPYRFDDATWVGNRLCELLPLPLVDRQRLVALTDGAARLEAVSRFLRDHGVG